MKSYMKALSVIFAASIVMLSLTTSVFSAPPVPPGILDPTTIPKFVNQLIGPPPVYYPTNITDPGTGALIRQEYMVNMTQFKQQLLPLPLPQTTVWGYGGKAKDAVIGAYLGFVANSPAPSFEAIRGVPVRVTWINNISTPHLFAVDPSIHWANPNDINMTEVMRLAMMGTYPLFPPGYDGTVTTLNPNGYNAQSPVPLVTHLHGGEVPSYFDGGPDEWFTWNGMHGPSYSTSPSIPVNPNAAVYDYPNYQQPATLWYHDHALGVTRINVMSGLAGFYLLREYNAALDPIAPLLPRGKYEVPLAIQDRTFMTNGELWFPTVGINPTMHPYWFPEFFGNTIMVNGLVWPNMNVDRGVYRFRLLDGSNARFYTISLLNRATNTLLPFIQIGSDGGYLKAPAPLTSLTIAPGERADILVDFSALPAGSKILVKNTAKAPFPAGTAADPQTVGQIMQFTVTANPYTGPATVVLPPALNPTLTGAVFPTLPATLLTRTLTLWEVMGMLGPLEVLLNGQKWNATLTELPKNGTVEDWTIPNLTADTHPIHLHLVQFQLVSRQKFDAKKYTAAWLLAQQTKLAGPPWNIPLANNAMPPWPLDFTPVEVPVRPYLQGKPTLPAPNEQGWKDTVQMNPGEVTIIRVRFMSQDGTPFPFDASLGPGYVWHCHIIDHEDNEMMRPYKVVL